MSTIQSLLNEYGESHQNQTNKIIHWVCVPLIMFSLMGLLYAIPFPLERSLFLNWAAVFLGLALIYYLILSISMFFGFALIAYLLLIGNHSLFNGLGADLSTFLTVSLSLFVAAWIGQFIGHKIEGEKPSFLNDLKFLLIGPAWLLHFIYKKLGIPY